MSQIVAIRAWDLQLILRIPDRGMPEFCSLGMRLWKDEEGQYGDLEALLSRAPRVNGMDVAVPSAVLLPTGGMGFFGWPAIAGHRSGRDFTLEFTDWHVDQQGDVCRLTGKDSVASIELEIAIDGTDCGVFIMQTRFTNLGADAYTLDRCMAGTMLIDEGPATLQHFYGMWGREFQLREAPLDSGLWLQESRRGRTSHDRFPAVIVRSEMMRGAWDGPVFFAAHVGWSGNHVIAVDQLDDGRRLIHAGELFEPGEVVLPSGKSYRSPSVYFARENESPDSLFTRFHRIVSRFWSEWPEFDDKPRPVTLNTWEANYFRHRIELLKAQATAAARLGVERFVLDDGWFTNRDDDSSGLGDWQADRQKYPNGLAPLAEHVRALGMEFGLWIEPEMVNPNSDLYRAHPDWVLKVEGRQLALSRHQLVLDLTRQEVLDYLFESIDRLLTDLPIAYLKWDMNRDLTHAGSMDGRAATSKQTRALYDLIDRVRSSHPTVEIESCASGGGRADYGILQRTQRIWTSDCTDALERLEIHRGASLLFPPYVLGAHVSASPNHQTGRSLSLAFRAIVAMPYHFGIELNPLALSEAEFNELTSWVKLHKRLRETLHGGLYSLPVNDGRYVLYANNHAGDGVLQRIIVIVVQAKQMLAEQPPPIRFNLEGPARLRIAAQHPPQPSYVRVSNTQSRLLTGNVVFTSTDLENTGLPLPMLRPESAVILEIERVEGN